MTVAVTSCARGGTLEARIQPGSVVTIGFRDFSGTTDAAAGLFVCATGPGVLLESVEPMIVEGSAELLGAVERSGTNQEERFIGAAYRYPPGRGEDNDPLGTTAVSACDEPSSAVTQIVVGARRTTPAGGAIRGISITYRSGERRETLDIPNFHIRLCGDHDHDCEP